MSIWQTDKWWKMLLASAQAESIFETQWIKIEKRKIWMWEYWLFILWITSPITPILTGEENKLIELCKKEKALFIQIETLSYNLPQSFNTKGGSKTLPLVLKEVPEEWGWWIINNHYKKFITPYTAIIDLKQTKEEILKKMKPKWRYNIRLAEKKWVEVKEVEKTKGNIKKFYELMNETTSRDKFSWNSLDYYITFLDKINSSKLLLAYKDEKIIAWWIFIFEKDVSIYYYWASTSNPKYRNLMAPYLLQWEAISIAKEKWSKLYDFLWVSSPWETNSSLSGVTSFKKKLTPDIREVSTSYIWINKKYKYYILIILRKIIRWIIPK